MQDFLHWVRSGDTVIKRDLDQGDRDEVRIMTVHGAKGLQAPLVFLPDTTSVPRDTDRILWGGESDVPLWAPRRAYETEVMAARRDDTETLRIEEYRRLLYVALTRAEDRLIVCGAAPKTKLDPRCWYEQVVAGISAKGRKEGIQLNGWSGEGWIYETGEAATGDAVATAPLPPPDVSRLLTLPAPEDDPPQPLTPSRAVAEEPPVFPPLAEDGSARFRRGLVIHRLLQCLPELPPDQWEGAAARYLARPATGIAAGQAVDIAGEVLTLLRDPAFAPMFGAGSRAEVPLTGMVGAHVVSGQVDRLVVRDGAVSIVDYKTNRPPPADEAGVAPLYATQMALYRALLQRIYPDHVVNCYLLWTAEPRIMKLSNGLLEGHLPTSGVVDPAGTAT
jgi:ATP-dependent helicase/nuclease subunit A